MVAARPDVLVIIDSPDFTHRVARKVRAADPAIPIVNYVSPSVWAWRPWRARSMRGLCRSRACVAAIRARRSRPAWRAAVQLCGSSSDRTDRRIAAECRGERTPDERSACAARLAGKQAWRNPPNAGRLRRRHRASARWPGLELVLPTVPHLAPRIAAATARWRAAAAHRRRPRRKMGGVPDRARGAGEIGHRDA